MNTLLVVLTGLTLGIVAFASSSDTITFDNAETGQAPGGLDRRSDRQRSGDLDRRVRRYRP